MRAGRRSTGFSRKPLRGFARERPDRACRAGRRTRTAAAALVESKDRRRSGGVALWRTGHRQVSIDGGAAGAPCPNHTRACVISAPPAHRQRVLSDHRPDGTRCRIGADDTPQAKLDKLDAMLAQTSTSIQDAALFAEMLSLPNDGRYPALDLTPQQRRQRTLEALFCKSRHREARIRC